MRNFALALAAIMVALLSAPRASGGDCSLGPVERVDAARCASPLVANRVGYRGSFDVHLKSTVDRRMTARVEDSPRWVDMSASPCVALAQAHPSCAWLVAGPYPSWRVSPE